MSLPLAASALPSRRPPVLVGISSAIENLRREIAAAARTQAKVLIVGETGVGKEVVAQSIHAQGDRAAKPFIAVNCSGIPETLLASELFGHVRGSFTGAYRDKLGLVRQADRGTLFLDELGEMSLAMQAAVLRFTETGEIQPVGADAPIGRTDVRLITATNRDLRAQVESGEFRQDLYYRLNVIQIRVPPLRERGDDILLLFQHYLAQAAAAHEVALPVLSAEARQLLMSHAWPGNVRELKNMTERLVLRAPAGTVTPADLPGELREAATAGTSAPPQPAAAAVSPSSGTEAAFPSHGLDATAITVGRLWERLMSGEDFWTAVQQPFRARQLTRTDLAALIDRGLQHTCGSYRRLVRIFNLPPEDYKRFHAFLYQQQCNLPVAPYRRPSSRARGLAGHEFYSQYSTGAVS